MAWALLVVAGSTVAHAGVQLSAYGGFSAAHDSDVTISGPTDFSGSVGWDSESFEAPPYYGVRGTIWFELMHYGEWGVAIDFTHDKIATESVPGFTEIEFTNGINYATLNALKRWAMTERARVYAGLGAGVSVPHVEAAPVAGPRTFAYQLGGPVVQAMVGVDVALAEWLSVFGEYKVTHSWNEADLRSGGSIDFNLLSHQFILGLSIAFGGPAQPPQ